MERRRSGFGVRDEREWGRIEFYIQNNPVKAGLVSRAEEYRWSSAWSRKSVDTSVDAARTSACATGPGRQPLG